MVVSKTELVNRVHSAAHVEGDSITKTIVDRVINAFVDEVMEAVAAGDSVSIKGFGTFEPRRKAEKTISNNITSAPVVVPAHVSPAFKPGATFKDMVKSS